jgi:methylated-DNA-protein-cysteine methyltransferase-like protein
MENIFSPLFTRMGQKYTRFPLSCGISFTDSPNVGGFVRLRENVALMETFSGPEELIQLVTTPCMPEIVCFSANPGQRNSWIFTNALTSLRADNLQVLLTENEMVQKALDIDALGVDIAEFLLQMGFSLRPEATHPAVPAIFAALTGYYYLNDEYEHLEDQQSIVPLLIDWDPLYAFLRQIPYGEVATFADAAKTLGLQWNEQTVMAALERLPAGAEVPGHRIVNRDGSVSTRYPGGADTQKERLKWELVPMQDKRRVNLKQAAWTRQKYRPLTNYLRHSVPDAQFLELHFSELEQVLNGPLPRAARRLGAWWRDEKPHAYIWQEAGCRIARVNLQSQMVTFSRSKKDS